MVALGRNMKTLGKATQNVGKDGLELEVNVCTNCTIDQSNLESSTKLVANWYLFILSITIKNWCWWKQTENQLLLVLTEAVKQALVIGQKSFNPISNPDLVKNEMC